ncbi:MAG: EAL domain-containing protein [Lachnospiraceae bacterium]|nr:EAL domain-containing protein [Lachnospiraceae bacterium]
MGYKVNDPAHMKRLVPNFGNLFNAGSVIFRENDQREFIFVNDSIVRLYECSDPQDFADYVHGHYDGLINPMQRAEVIEDFLEQVREKKQKCGYMFFTVTTKSGVNIRVVNHWSLFEDEIEGRLIYAWMFLHRVEDTALDFDSVTGLFTKHAFIKAVKGKLKQYDPEKDETYGFAYINLVNFKLFNIEHGKAKGDECLMEMGFLLLKSFPGAVIARLSDDHFAIFDKAKGIKAGLQEVKRRFDQAYRDHYNLVSKYGIYELAVGENPDPEEALSMAKMTCDFIKSDLKDDIMEYSCHLANKVMTREYIVRKLDEALEKEWIKVYYQPVIRALTGELCGMESLTRWIDPEIGFLPPNEFIETLESNHLIHKLDSYVVEKVCAFLHERLEAGLPVVPVSVNFSRMDFVLCDMLDVVETAVKKYDIPRDFLHIEITESMIASDEELMTSVISKFREAGYEIWMDDFGSGYSSLTMLKDYHFDTLKMDMRFLTPFTEKSKCIMRATVIMAKDVGIKTLAEGVETEEQLQFLRDIGCGMIQGYYYGKPEPVADTIAHMEEKQISSEQRSWRKFYETAGFESRDTDAPLEIIEDDGEHFHTLYMNCAYRKQILPEDELDLGLEEIDSRIYRTNSPLLSEYRKIADQLRASGKQETFYYTGNGQYLNFTGKVIAANRGHVLIRGSLLNLTKDVSRSTIEKLDNKLGELNHLFELVLWLKPDEDSVSPLLGSMKYTKGKDVRGQGLRREQQYLIDEILFPADRERYARFVDLETLKSRIDASENGYLADVFGFKQSDGRYKKQEILLMRIPAISNVEFLFCMKPYLESAATAGKESVSWTSDGKEIRMREYSDIWESVLWKSRQMFFWKDENRRFRGVSRAFREYFGITDEAQILGKTEEEMDWLVDRDAVRDLELEIMSSGSKHPDQPTRVVIDGEVRDVVCTRMALYDEGRIAGILGRFEDLGWERRKMTQKQRALRTDNVSGLLNERAFLELLAAYERRHQADGKEYGLILLNNAAHDRIRETYDEETAEMLLREISECLNRVAGNTCTVARLQESFFGVLVPKSEVPNMQQLADEIYTAVDAIRRVDEKPVTLRLKLACKSIDDEDVTDENIYDKALDEVL